MRSSPVAPVITGKNTTRKRSTSPARSSAWHRLTLPIVLWAGTPFFVRGAQSIVNRSPNMWTLISLGTGSAFVYSVVATIAPQVFPDSFISMGRVAVYFEAAAVIMQRLLVDPLPANTILNVNVPDRPWAEIRGFEVTRLGHRHRSEPCIAQEDPRGRPIWWIGAAGAEQDAGPGTDFHSVRMGYISITPIHVDLTRYQALEKVASWVGALEAALPR